MVSNSIEQNKFFTNNSFSNQFSAIIGILSVLSWPIFFIVWGMEPIGVGKYIGVLGVFVLIFLLLLLIAFRWGELVHSFFVFYVTLVMPVFFFMAPFAVVGVLSLTEYVIIFTVLQVICLLIWFFARNYLLNLPLFDQANRIILFLFPLGYGIIFWTWLYCTYDLLSPAFAPAWRIVPFIFFIILLFLWVFDLAQRRSQPIYHWMLLGLTGLLLIGLVYRPELFVDREHYNFFMAPLNDFIHGKTPFVNTTSQYGIGVIYALALVFRGLNLPIGYEGLSFIVNMLFVFQYILLAFMLWRTTDDWTLGIAGLIVIVYFNYLSVNWPSMLRTPAQSPLRYGLVYLSLCVAMLNVKSSSRQLQILEYIFLGIASVWSLETFLYVFISLDSFYFVKDVLFAPQFGSGIKCFGKRVVVQSGIVILSWGTLFFLERVASGEFPNLYMYLDYYRAYGNIVYNGGPISSHVFRSGIVIFIYLFSIFAVLFDRTQPKKNLSMIVASMLVGMSVAGVLQYIYYFVYYIDYHLALLCVPLIFVLVLWTSVVRQHIDLSLPLRASLVVTLIVSLIINTVVTSIGFQDKFSKSLLYLSVRGAIKNQSVTFTSPYQVFPSNKEVTNLVHLIQYYASSDQQIAIFVSSDDQAEALFLTGKTDLLGMSEPDMSSISPLYSEFVLRRARAMAGQPTYIFYDNAKDALIPLQQEAYETLFAATDYTVIDKRRNIIVLKKTE